MANRNISLEATAAHITSAMNTAKKVMNSAAEEPGLVEDLGYVLEQLENLREDVYDIADIYELPAQPWNDL